MKTATPLCAVVVAAMTSVASAAQEARPEAVDRRLPVVVTQGEALLRRAPDRAFVDLAVETRAREPKQATSRNAQIMTAVQERLRALGLPAEAIQTRAYDLHPEFDHVDGKQVPRGYVARNLIEVRLDAIERAGEVIDAAIAAGATGAGGIRFDLKDRETVEREALKLAVADARARAEAAAAGAGAALGRLLRIEEAGRGRVRPPVPFRGAAMAEMAQVDTPIATGEIEIRAAVTLTIELR